MKLKTLGKVAGILAGVIGVLTQDASAVLFGAFIFFANTKIGE